MESILKIFETMGVKLLYGIIVLVVGLFLVHWLMKFLSGSEVFNKIEATLRGFLENLIKIGLYIVVVLTAASVMGIPLTSFVTILASAGVAVSLALQGALSNLVGGMIIILLKPFKAGDYVCIGESEGTVQRIGAFYTEIVTLDRRHISLPNSNLTNTAIVNCSSVGSRCLDVLIGVSYRSDIDQVRQTLMGAARETPNVLTDPEPLVKLADCSDSALTFLIRVWCPSSDYLEVGWTLREKGKRALDRAGIEIPYPQVDVHMKS